MEISGLQGIENIAQMQALANARRSSSADPRVQAKVKEEFMALFYKELLKQAFKAPKSGLGAEENESSMLGSFSSDLLVEQLAMDLVRSRSFSADKILPAQILDESQKW